jgi:hypothetical protein
MNSIWMTARTVEFRTLYIDANRINSRQGLPYMNQIERWADDEVIFTEMTEVSQREAFAGENPYRLQKASEYIASCAEISTPEERRLVVEIGRHIFPNGPQNLNERRDVLNVFIAIKYDGILLNNDRAVRSAQQTLTRLRAVTIMTDQEAVAFIDQKVSERDRRIRLYCKDFDEPVPQWCGRDHSTFPRQDKSGPE